jgi:hypothetical protein
MINNNNRTSCLLTYHIICGIIYLICIPLSIYGYYAFATSLSLGSPDFTWLIVCIILDILVCTLSIVECAISGRSCCGSNPTPQAPVIMMYPPNVNYTSAPAASVPPAGNVQDPSKRDWLPPNTENTEGKVRKFIEIPEFY